jgi:hypothetical protein
MADKKSEKMTIEAYKGEKADGNVDASKWRKSSATPPSSEVEGHGKWIFVNCPYCGNYGYINYEYQEPGYVCWHCHHHYHVWY